MISESHLDPFDGDPSLGSIENRPRIIVNQKNLQNGEVLDHRKNFFCRYDVARENVGHYREVQASPIDKGIGRDIYTSQVRHGSDHIDLIPVLGNDSFWNLLYFCIFTQW